MSAGGLGGLLALMACVVASCNGQSGQVDDFGGMGLLEAPARRGSIVALACSLDEGQKKALESSVVEGLVSDVVFLCFDIDTKGEAQPSDAATRQALASDTAWAAGLGYHVKVGVSLGAGTATGKSVSASPFSSAALRAEIVSNVTLVAGYGDGVELDLRNLPDAARDDVTQIVTQVAAVVRPKGTVGVFVPPAAPDPTGVAPGDAVDVGAIATRVNRIRVMTLDYSRGDGPGPTIDSGWAVDSARLALAVAGQTPVDVSMPLYGWHFDATDQQMVTYTDAQALEADEGATVERAPSGAPWFSYEDPAGDTEEVWFDDAKSTVLTLAAWPTTVLPAGVGVVFYDLGAEDPGVWNAIEEAKP
jgi:spore germination protein YaaH